MMHQSLRCPARPPHFLLPQATADAWLQRVHGDGAFNGSFAAFLAVLPQLGEVLTPDTMSEVELAMLQGGPLVSNDGTVAILGLSNTCRSYWHIRAGVLGLCSNNAA